MSELLPKDREFIVKHYKDTTSKNILTTANTLVRFARKYEGLEDSTGNDLTKLLLQKEFLLAYVESYPNTATQRNKMGTLHGLMEKIELHKTTKKRIFTQEYLDHFSTEQSRVSKVDQDAKDNKLNQHRQNIVEQKLTIKDLYNALDYYEKKAPYSKSHLILALCTYLLPRRLEWQHCVFVKSLPTNPDKKLNYIVLSRGKVRLVYYNFKTAHKMGVWDRTLENKNFEYKDAIKLAHPRFNPERMRDIFIESYRRKPRTYFIELTGGDSYTQSGCSMLMKAAFTSSIKKNVNNTDLRAIVISAIFNNPRINLPSKYETQMANDMGQKDSATQRAYRIIQLEEDDFETAKLPEIPREKLVAIPPEVAKEDKRVALTTLQGVKEYVRKNIDLIEKA